MHFPTIAAALLLPFVAATDLTTITSTSTRTLTKTVTIQRAAATHTAHNSTAILTTPSATLAPSSSSTTPPASSSTGGASGLGAAQAAMLGVAGLFAAVAL
ncbi:uncharacterized protein C8A04DRAFT_32353 [Dichotomopilus funicola]|uniref:Uncharacterized protein n=1 Tax=Dichotomopilus funicola TaxID=1934379 RepID=A0AAN6UYD1_9PEZI|nr:hypothetical protein C8A04DRAFT_32353 [Dichotomopilus funicola]